MRGSRLSGRRALCARDGDKPLHRRLHARRMHISCCKAGPGHEASCAADIDAHATEAMPSIKHTITVTTHTQTHTHTHTHTHTPHHTCVSTCAPRWQREPSTACSEHSVTHTRRVSLHACSSRSIAPNRNSKPRLEFRESRAHHTRHVEPAPLCSDAVHRHSQGCNGRTTQDNSRAARLRRR